MRPFIAVKLVLLLDSGKTAFESGSKNFTREIFVVDTVFWMSSWGTKLSEIWETLNTENFHCKNLFTKLKFPEIIVLQ